MNTLYIHPASKDLQLDAQNRLQMVEGGEEEKQSLRLLLSTNLGEWFLNEQQHGLDYRMLLVKNFNRDLVKEAIRQALNQEPRVSEILSLDVQFDRQGRQLVILFQVRMGSGNVITDEVVV